MYEQRKELAKAIEIYQEQFPQSPAAQERIGGLLLDQNKPEDAIAPLEFAVAKGPNAGNQAALVQAYIRAKPSGQSAAAGQLPTNRRVNPVSSTSISCCAGASIAEQRNFKEAANSFYAATKLKPDSVEAWNANFATMLNSLEELCRRALRARRR